MFDDIFKAFPDIPKTVEDARKLIEDDEEIAKWLETASLINGLAQLLINKGFITEEEFNIWYKASRESILNMEAKKLLKMFNEEE